jgi:aryl-alcohol dehydrogenase-like predicted oxidoreductase
MKLQDKLVIGSAQFGLNYGINNINGIVQESDVFKILDFMLSNKINEIDTSYLYGNSENVLGKYKNINKLKINSKCPSIDKNIKKYFNLSLERLNVNSVNSYLIHHFDFFIKNISIWEDLKELKNNGKVNEIGFSLYYPEEFEFLIEKNIYPDIVQIPYNIFDQRFDYIINNEMYKKIKFYIRSVFLQGLLFISPNNLKPEFESIKNKIFFLNQLSKQTSKSITKLCLGFVLENQNINKIILGIERLEQLKDIINSFEYLEPNYYNQLKDLKEDNEKIILPFNWSK